MALKNTLFELRRLAGLERRYIAEGEKRHLRIYDCDDTLISSESRITVHKGDETLELDSATFAHFKPSEGDTLDFSDFNHITRPRIIKKNFEAFRADAQDPDTEVVILTARPKGSATAIEAFIEAQGVKISMVIALASSDPDDKGRWVVGHMKEHGYDDVRFIDDSRANVNAVVGFVKKAANVDVKGVNVPHPKEADYAGPTIPKQFPSKAPAQAQVKYTKPGDHTPSEWWKAQSADFKRNYCLQHGRSKYCRQGHPS